MNLDLILMQDSLYKEKNNVATDRRAIHKIQEFSGTIKSVPIFGDMLVGLGKLLRSRKVMAALLVFLTESSLAVGGTVEFNDWMTHTFWLALTVILSIALEDTAAKFKGTWKPG